MIKGQVYVAKYYPGKALPRLDGFTNVLIHVSEPLSPYVLKNEKGQLLENIWQFSKLYQHVSKQQIRLSSRHANSRVIWEHPHEIHMDTLSKEVTPSYWAWREKGMNNPYAIRYPNGWRGRTACVCSIWNNQRLDYIAARKAIYCGEYARLAPQTDEFKRLYKLLGEGTNLLIIEVDGPDPSLTYPPYDQISKEKPAMRMTEETIRLLINDPKKPFGHGFVIAALLLDGQDWMK